MEPSTQTAPARPASTDRGGSGRDTVTWCATSTGRNVALISVDLIPGRPLRLWGAAVEVADGGAFIRLAILGPYDGWTTGQLLAVALARFEAEQAHDLGEAVLAEIVRHLDRAAAMHREPQDGWAVPPVSFELAPPGSPASPFPWSLARAGQFSIQMCPDAEARQRGVSPEQLLVLIEMALTSWLPVTPLRRSSWQARREVRAALALEAERARARWAAHLADCDAEPDPG